MKKYLFTLLIWVFLACQSRDQLFNYVDPEKSGVHFNNEINENDSINVLVFENVYNGGGVGIGDFNNDGLTDIYFTGNLVPNKLYLNKGDFKFQDLTQDAGVSGQGRWSRGVAVVDINNDGLTDMYVCTSVNDDPTERQNILYINQGIKNGIPIFKDMAEEYGLNDTTHSTMAAFFDYDNDQDLDVYIVVNDIISGDYPNRFRPRMTNAEHPSTGRLYRNDWNDSLKHGVFTNVSKEAGILIEGYGHAVNITDLNKDGWKDIYVTNDYLSNNILYINNGDGTFTDKVTEYFKHTSANAMGCDINDINNDGLMDLVELDMNPEDNYRKKMMLNANSYQTYQNIEHFNYQYQYVRNTLQLNQGPRILENDSVGSPVFSDISYYAGVAETDWSWTPLLTDFDNDGFRDLLVTNGFPRDVTDHDFITFRNSAFSVATRQQLLNQIPAVKIHNYAYKNNGNLTFLDVSTDWGLEIPSFSSGAAYADLDNDGDLDLVVNNINDKASLYENTISNSGNKAPHYLSISVKGDQKNLDGIGTWIELFYNQKMQVVECSAYRGYLSSVQSTAHFGLGTAAIVDSVVVKWPGNKKSVYRNVRVDQVFQVKIEDANDQYEWRHKPLVQPLFQNIGDSVGLNFIHSEIDYVDFNVQKLLPHKFSESGPAMAVGDIDANGLDDVVVGGSVSYSAEIFLQMKDGKFRRKSLFPEAAQFTKDWEDSGILLFDADGDGDLDLYIATGGYEHDSNAEAYIDKFYINDGKGNFTSAHNALPSHHSSNSCIRAADFDHDGDLDLLVAGRVDPWYYPKPVSSFIYRNDSKGGKIIFTDITKQIARPLENIGMISDAIWTDFNNDGWIDIVLAGEWMPVTFLKNRNGIFQNVTQQAGIENIKGWWRSIVPSDIDNDGDMDYIVGNLGLNSFYRATEKHPVRMYAKDFDNNGSFDAVPTIFLAPDLSSKNKKEFPVHNRDDMVKQMIGFRSKFQNYKSFAYATVDQMFSVEELKGALILETNTFHHLILINKGNATFDTISLPQEAQFSCINGMVANDFDNDGKIDLLINGNDYGTEVSVGRYDACNGLLLKGDGKGGFFPSTILQSGIFIPGNGKALVSLPFASDRYMIVGSQNRGPLKAFVNRTNIKIIKFDPLDVYAEITLSNGNVRRHEINYGSSFLSQSSRFLPITDKVVRLVVYNNKNQKRSISVK